MYATRNDLPEKVRIQSVAIMQARLADSVDLMIQAKQAHWNVKGANFIALHELFDRVSETVEGYVDLLAERIVQLGGTAEGTVSVAAEKSNLVDYPLEITNGKDHVAALSKALAVCAELIRQDIDLVQEIKDAGSADLLTEISRGLDKQLWLVEAHS